MARKLPPYKELAPRPARDKLPEEARVPAVFLRNMDYEPGKRSTNKVGHNGSERGVDSRIQKRNRLRDQLSVAWSGRGDQDRALQLAAYAVGGSIEDIPQEARESLATLTAWVFAMRAVGGSVEHFREIGDRVDPKPKRIEIEGAIGARRGGSSSNPDEAAEADEYYRLVSGAIIDAEFTKEDDLSFLD